MSLVDRLYRRLTAGFDGRARIVGVGDGTLGLSLSGDKTRDKPLSALVAATLIHRDVYSADAILLQLTFEDGEDVHLFLDDPLWDAVIMALDRTGRIAVASAQWQLQAIADGCNAPPRELMRR